jgi:hypothetical protein
VPINTEKNLVDSPAPRNAPPGAAASR